MSVEMGTNEGGGLRIPSPGVETATNEKGGDLPRPGVETTIKEGGRI